VGCPLLAERGGVGCASVHAMQAAAQEVAAAKNVRREAESAALQEQQLAGEAAAVEAQRVQIAEGEARAEQRFALARERQVERVEAGARPQAIGSLCLGVRTHCDPIAHDVCAMTGGLAVVRRQPQQHSPQASSGVVGGSG
jgi:hypothetical protein